MGLMGRLPRDVADGAVLSSSHGSRRQLAGLAGLFV